MPEYNWPSKIAKFGITCPFQKMLVAKYEGVIDWNGDQIRTPDALDRHLREKMLPELARRLDPKDKKSHYCRRVDLAAVLQNPAQHFDEIRAVRDREGEDAVEQILLDRINRDKKEGFDAWWQYMTEGNPVYAASPAFQYLLLRPVVDSSDAKCTRSPINPDAEALAHIHGGIQNGTLAPTENLLKVLCEFIAFGKRQDGDRPTFGTACGWVVVTKAMDKAAYRVAALAQGSGWCVASPMMAQSYLCHSDFNLLVENGRAVAAVRTDKGMAVEIQGKGNSDPSDWWPRIMLYCSARAFDIIISARKASADAAALKYRNTLAAKDDLKQLSAHLKLHPAQVQFVPNEMANDENYRPAIETAWLACVKADPMCAALAPDWMERDKRMDQMVIEGWIQLLDIDPNSARRIPAGLQARKELANQIWMSWGLLMTENPHLYKDCPADLLSDPDIIMACKRGWISLLTSDPRHFKDCPGELKGNSEILATLRRVWEERVRMGLRNICVPYCPQSIVEPLLTSMNPTNPNWYHQDVIATVRKHPPLTFTIPLWLKRKPEIFAVLKQIFTQEWPLYWARERAGVGPYQTTHFWSGIPKRLHKHPALLQQHEDNWRNYCSQHPAQALWCPVEVITKKEVFDTVRHSVERYIALSKPRAKYLMQEWQRALRVRKPLYSPEVDLYVRQVMARINNIDRTFASRPIEMPVPEGVVSKADWILLLHRSPTDWERCPTELRADPEISAARIVGWVELSANTLIASSIPSDLLHDLGFREKLNKMWLRQKDLTAEEWLKCPDFIVIGNPGIHNRISAAITRSLRRNPSFWLSLPPFWRQNSDLQQQAAECWARSPTHGNKEPPEDIGERVKGLLVS